MAEVKPSAAAQLVLNKWSDTQTTFISHGVYELIMSAWPYCHEVFTPGNIASQLDIQTLMKGFIDTERKYTDTAIKGVVGQLTALENTISQSNKNIAGNQLQLQNNLQGVKKAIADLTTHNGNTASIIAAIKNQVDGNSKEATMLRELIKDHTATKHHSQPDPVVYAWDVQPYELGIRTKTSVPATGHTYEYKYTYQGKEYSIVNSDANLKVGVELGTLTYTPLSSGVTKVVIERTS